LIRLFFFKANDSILSFEEIESLSLHSRNVKAFYPVAQTQTQTRKKKEERIFGEKLFFKFNASTTDIFAWIYFFSRQIASSIYEKLL